MKNGLRKAFLVDYGFILFGVRIMVFIARFVALAAFQNAVHQICVMKDHSAHIKMYTESIRGAA